MESCKKIEQLIQVIKSAHQSLEIVVSTDLVNKDLSHVKVLDLDISGYGSAFTLYESILKAYSEYFERKSIYVYNSNVSVNERIETSNGVAAHSSKRKAQENSYLELLERDIFFTSWIASVGPSWELFEKIPNGAFLKIEEIVRKFQLYQYEVMFGILCNKEDIKCGIVLVSAVEKGVGIAVDTCAGFSWDEIITKLEISASYYATLVENRKKQGVFNISKRAEQFAKTSDVLDYYLDPKNRLPDFFQQGNKGLVGNFLFSDVDSSSIEVAKYLPNPLGIHVIRSASDRLQKFFIGHPKEKDINLTRVSDVFGDRQINWLIPPLP